MGLQNLNGRWYYVQRIPSHLFEAYKELEGKKSPHIKVALRTRDENEARRYALAHEQAYELLRIKLENYRRFTPEQIATLRFQLKFRKLCRTRNTELDLNLMLQIQQQLQSEYTRIKAIAERNSDPDAMVTPILGRYKGKDVTRVAHRFARLRYTPKLLR